MMQARRFQSCISGAVIVTLAVSWSGATRAHEVPGIAAEPSTTGPSIAVDGGYMVPYTAIIPGTDVTFEMVPIPGGKFLLGSPDDEEGRGDDEGPQVEVTVLPFWMSKYELTWAEYQRYMALNNAFQAFEDRGIRKVADDNQADAITAPSKLYEPSFTFGSGEDPRQPAVTMTQYAAKQYTKWLSVITGQSYRLPTEAEWEYACRAGTTTAYWFGDDAEQLGEHDWFYDNADDASQIVGQKSANPWGLYDMHGNVAEWTLDAHDEAGYEFLTGKSNLTAADAVNWPTKLFPRVLRGGSYFHDAVDCRSAKRFASDDENWRAYDPNQPKSPWWLASDESLFVGMRIIRVPGSFDASQRERYWEADTPIIMTAANKRIDDEGKGERGIVDPELPAAMRELKP